ncbi:Type-1 restriction enzyme EcoKI specificity protein [Ferriphaselus amnicola]|uniref:Type-1 restriction enzyme EcoKI specificity protein n=1 Tax=Ferriphaselus amnicola TaxID=1188319 RepID=A0A2Z6GE31_9PROT|nr:restriction endonuclease subunit S [Ferriphaselus amnicola]BBE51873.1 Type-1 restriction enzyme EcoKI specificity protein [Ferriphaselus amnicola]
MSLPRYSEYKDSGVEWLGEVPEHWGIAPFYSVATEREESNVGMQEDNLLSLSYGRIVQKDISSNDGLLPESFETYQIVRPGDIVFRLTDLQNDKRSLRTAIVEETGIITFAYVAAKPTKIESRYLCHLLRAYDVTKVFYSMGGGLRQSMKFSDLKRLPTLLPPPDEQQAIAAFLDRETGKIDALIAEQQRLVVVLAEKRQAVISHAVTKGLNPKAKMKDSGIEWLGEVPEHWDVMRLKHIKALTPNAFVDGPFGSNLKSVHFIDDGDVYVIESNFATQGKLEPSELKTISSEHFESIRRSETKAGDIVIAKIGAQFGKASVLPSIDKPAVVSGNSMKLTVDETVCTTLWAYWQLYILKASGEIDLLNNGSAQPALSLSAMNQLVFLLPQIDEQKIILAFLDTETAKFDTLTAESNRAIALLQERRSALISAAVTGKIDVRQAV